MTREEQIAWAAGFFEGEGCISVRARPNTRATGPSTRLTVSNTDLDVLQRFHRIVGDGTILGPEQRRAWHKPCWRWSVENAVGVIRILRLLQPHLGERRAAKAEEATVAAWATLGRQLIKGSEHTLLGVRVRAHPWHQLAEALGEE